jgi:diguanylate cyclase (GGDEF)-like protein
MAFSNSGDSSRVNVRGIIREIEDNINYNFHFNNIVDKILINIEKFTNCKTLSVCKVDLSQNKRIVFESHRLKNVDKDKREPLFSYPILLLNRRVAYTLDIYSIEGGVLPKNDDSNLWEFIRLLTEAVNKEAIKIDSLTGLYSREHFDTKLPLELMRAVDNSENVAIFMIDIDHFKDVNDTYGHPIGDRVLQNVSSIIVDKLDGSGIPARYGGEEIIILIRGVNKTKAYEMADLMRRGVEESYIEEGNEKISVTISLGIALYPVDSDDPDEMVKLADSALYRAKNEGRNQVRLYDESDDLSSIDISEFDEISPVSDNAKTKKNPPILQQLAQIKTIIGGESLKKSVNTFSAVFVDEKRGNIFILDKAESCLYCFSKSGELIYKFGEKGEGRGVEMSEPVDVFVDVRGNIWIVDSLNHAVKKFDQTGNLIKIIAEFDDEGNPVSGQRKGTFNLPYAIVGSGKDRIMVAERQNRRIQVFDLAGKFIEEISLPQFSREGYSSPDPIDLCSDDSGYIYVLDQTNMVIIIIGPDREIIGKIEGMERNKGNFSGLVSVSCGDNRISSLIPSFPNQIVATAEMGDVNRVQFFTREGEYIDMIDLSVYSSRFGNIRPTDIYISKDDIYILTQDEENILITLNFVVPEEQ